MTFATVCSGIGAPDLAAQPLGWHQAFCAEIEPFPCAVLEQRFPGIPNYGDITKFKEWPDHAGIDVLIGGTPCQSFSVAGLRKGMDDPRGNLALTFLAIARRYAPTWLLWENVPGVLSSNEGRDFGAFLGGLAELGYGFAYRILDAQYFGVAQRRRRVFVVGHLGDWRRAAAVLFERESLSGNPPPRRESREGIAPTISARTKAGGGLGTDFDCDGGLIVPELARCVATREGASQDWETTTMVADTVRSHPRPGSNSTGQVITMAIRGRNDSSDLEVREDGTANALLTPSGGRGGIGVGAVAISANQRGEFRERPVHGSLSANKSAKQFDGVLAPTLRAMPNQGPGRMADDAARMMMVRRLTPRECERLMGFPDDFTAIQYRGKIATDSPRYRALGNSMAVPVVRWILDRINKSGR